MELLHATCHGVDQAGLENRTSESEKGHEAADLAASRVLTWHAIRDRPLGTRQLGGGRRDPTRIAIAPRSRGCIPSQPGLDPLVGAALSTKNARKVSP